MPAPLLTTFLSRDEAGLSWALRPYLSHASLWTSVPTTQKGSTGADSLCTPSTCAQLRFLLLTLFLLSSSVPASSTVHPWLLIMLPASFCLFSQRLPSLWSPSWLSGITLHRCSKWLLCWLHSLAKHPRDCPLGKSTCMAEVGKLKLHFPCSFAQISLKANWALKKQTCLGEHWKEDTSVDDFRRGLSLTKMECMICLAQLWQGFLVVTPQ